MNSTVSRILAQQEELVESFNTILCVIKPIATIVPVGEGTHKCCTELLASYDSLVIHR